MEDIISNTILEVGKMVLYLQTIGIILILWIIFNIITLIINRKRRKALYSIKTDIERIERKLDKLSKNKH